MKLTTSTTGETALLIRPLPRAMVTGDEPICFGGKPRLPPHMAWPGEDYHCPEHFVAEVDFSKLSKKVANCTVPNFPKQGTLFVFLPLFSDGVYDGEKKANVLYTSEDIRNSPEREPPEDLPDLRESDFTHVHPDGTQNDGQILVRQAAEVIPYLSQGATNPLRINMMKSGGQNVSPWEQANKQHEKTLELALKSARKMPVMDNDASRIEKLAQAIPKDMIRFNYDFAPHHLDWEFIFDWAKEFYRLCYCLTLQHIGEMKAAGDRHFLLKPTMKRLKKKRNALSSRKFGEGRRPIFWTFDAPRPVKDDFDWQAERWLSLSQFETGRPSLETLAAFIDMLAETLRHYKRTDDEGYNLGPRIGMLDNRIAGHDKHAGNTFADAGDAFKVAAKNAVKRQSSAFDALSQLDRWDRRVIDANTPSPSSPNFQFKMGTMPPQMFGHGFDIQTTVADHADDVLLLQLGDSFGLPIQFGPSVILHLWIAPDDLANGRFDNVRQTLDMD